MAKRILIVGSLNMDFVTRVQRIPIAGETLSGDSFATFSGGKGANQAVTAGRLGGRAEMIGCIGRDPFGEALLRTLKSARVGTGFVRVARSTTTGVATIAVDADGQNSIIVVPGANGELTPGDVSVAISGSSDGILLVQLETPMETVEAAIEFASTNGLTVVLDPAPARPLAGSLLRKVDFLTPNESEALTLLGETGTEIAVSDAEAVGKRIVALGPANVILKLGAAGAMLVSDEKCQHFPAPIVKAVDSTAAGDCFNGAFAVALAEGSSVEDAIGFACRAASFSVTKPGAQNSLPTRAELENWNND